ncbi:MAG: hypothetical protein HYZ28_09795 [Myxococcales bacterium]|nr:hypothetical protein [Myxococcales bacterium]
MSVERLSQSKALWNRSRLELRSDELLAQLLDRGGIEDWRELYALCRNDSALRQRIGRIVLTVPLPMPRLWLAALAALGEDVDLSVPLPSYADQSV